MLKRLLFRWFFRGWLSMCLGWLKTEEQSRHYRIAAFLCAPDFLILLALFPTNLKQFKTSLIHLHVKKLRHCELRCRKEKTGKIKEKCGSEKLFMKKCRLKKDDVKKNHG